MREINTIFKQLLQIDMVSNSLYQRHNTISVPYTNSAYTKNSTTAKSLGNTKHIDFILRKSLVSVQSELRDYVKKCDYF